MSVPKQRMLREALLLVLLPPLLFACAPKSADLNAPFTAEDTRQQSVLFARMQYDTHGLPRFSTVLAERPSEAGDQYAVVYYAGGRPVKSYEIAVTGERKPDLTRPLEVLFRWTGAGFMVGASMVYGTGQIQFTYDARTNMVYTSVALAPVIVMTTGGFIVGVVAGMFSAGEELRYALLRPQDVVMSVSLFEYDSAGRLERFRIFLPDEKTEVTRTEYRYAGNEDVPIRAENTSYPEKKVRTIEK